PAGAPVRARPGARVGAVLAPGRVTGGSAGARAPSGSRRLVVLVLARGAGSRHPARGSSLAHWSAAAPSGSRRLAVLVPRTPFRLPSSRSGLLAGARCPEWDSNPHWIGFEPIASAGWAIGAQ